MVKEKRTQLVRAFLCWFSRNITVIFSVIMGMKKYIRNSGKQWTPKEERTLVQLASANTPTRVIGLELGRPVGGVRAKAQQLKISLRPTNQSPYNRGRRQGRH